MSINIKSLDGDIQLEEKLVNKSNYLAKKAKDSSEVVLEVKKHILEKVFEYLRQYETEKEPTIPEPLPEGSLDEILKDKWAAEFISKVDYETNFEIINAAALLELDNLHDLACARIAHFMKGKTPDEVNEQFTIECQLTNDEAKELGLNVEEES